MVTAFDEYSQVQMHTPGYMSTFGTVVSGMRLHIRLEHGLRMSEVTIATQLSLGRVKMLLLHGMPSTTHLPRILQTRAVHSSVSRFVDIEARAMCIRAAFPQNV